MAIRTAFIAFLLLALPLSADERPTLNETQRLTLENRVLALQLAQERLQATVKDYTVSGYVIDLSTMTYVSAPKAESHWVFEVHIYHHVEVAGVTQQIDLFLTRLNQVIEMNAETQAKVDTLEASIAQLTTVEQSAETAFSGLAAEIAALKGANLSDPATLAALDAATLKVSTVSAHLVAAITAATAP